MVAKVANKAKTVSAKWVVRLQGDETRVMVKSGEKVKVGQVLAAWVVYEKCLVSAAGVLRKLKADQRQDVIKSLEGRKVEAGELLVKSGGLFQVKITAPVKGEVTGVDDFENITIKLTDQLTEGKIVSPVEAVVDKLEDDKITLKFKAIELTGQGSEGGKAWGDCDLKLARSLFEVKSEMEGKILLTEDVSDTFLLKAEVVGVKGVVVVGRTDENDLKTSLPVVSVPQEELEKLNGLGGEEPVRVLLNSKLGRVLVVVQ